MLKQVKDKSQYESQVILEFGVGQAVKIFTPLSKKGRCAKLLLKWAGPFYITRKVNDVDYKICKSPDAQSPKDIIHVNRILPCHPWLLDVACMTYQTLSRQKS